MRILAERKRDEGTRGNKSKKKHAEEDRIRQMRQQQEIERSAQSRQSNSVYACPWKVLLSLSHDPYPELAKLSKQVIKSIQDKIQDKVWLKTESALFPSLIACVGGATVHEPIEIKSHD